MAIGSIARMGAIKSGFPYAETAGGDVRNRGEVESLADMRLEGTEKYHSIYAHSEEFKRYAENPATGRGTGSVKNYDGPVFPLGVHFDLDGENALPNTVALLDRIEGMGVDLKDVEIYYSGSKGFHLEIPAALFGGIEPGVDAHKRVKWMARELADGIADLDPMPYAKTNLWRAEGTINGKSGLYKTELTAAMVRHCSLEEIKERAAEPQEPVSRNTSLETVPALAALRESVPDLKKSVGIIGRRPNTNRAKTLTRGRLQDTADVLVANIPENERHNIWLAFCGYGLNIGMKPDDILSVGEDAWNRLKADDEAFTDLHDSLEDTIDRRDQDKPYTGGGELDKLLPGLAQKIRGIVDPKSAQPEHDEIRNNILDSGTMFSYFGKEWRKYEDGTWPIVDEIEARNVVADALEDMPGVKFSGSLVDTITKLVRDKSYVRADMWDQDDSIIVCQDNVLELNTMTTRAHDPHDYATRKLAFNYVPRAKAPTFYKYLRDRFPDPLVRGMIQEFIGLALTTNCDPELILWLIGPGQSGKSTLVEAIRRVLGDRAGILKLADISSRFGLSDLPGKTLLTATEQPAEYVKDLDSLNEISSGEEVSFERKNVNREKVRSTAKIFWAMNELPKVRAVNNGFWRRIHLVTMPPLTGAKDQNIKRTILNDELEGVFSWAVRGLERLRRRGWVFVVPQSVTDATAAYQRSSDPLGLFLEQRTVAGDTDKTMTSFVFDAYRLWCARFTYKPMPGEAFKEEMMNRGFEYKKRKEGRFFMGIDVPTLDADEKNQFGGYDTA